MEFTRYDRNANAGQRPHRKTAQDQNVTVPASDQHQIPDCRDRAGRFQRTNLEPNDSVVRIVVLGNVVIDLEVIQVAAHFALFDT